MKKFTAIFIAAVMVVIGLTYAVSVNAEDVNLLAGKTYIVTTSDGAPDFYNGLCNDPYLSILTDGIIRQGDEYTAGGAGVAGKSVEFAGTLREFSVAFNFNAPVSIDSVQFDGARRASNRYLNCKKIEVSGDGINFTSIEFTESLEAIDGAAQYSPAPGGPAYDQFFTITESFSRIDGIRGLRITLNTAYPETPTMNPPTGGRGYIVQLDEIRAFGNLSPVSSSAIASSAAPYTSEVVSSSAPPVSSYPYSSVPPVSSSAVVSSNPESSVESSVVIVPVKTGDVNGDDKVDSLDASLVLQHDAGLSLLTGDNLIAADVNGDDKVDSLDASLILQFDAGLIHEFVK